MFEDGRRRFAVEQDSVLHNARSATRHARTPSLLVELVTKLVEESSDSVGARVTPRGMSDSLVVDLRFHVQETQMTAGAQKGHSGSSSSSTGGAEIRRNQHPSGQALLITRHGQDGHVDGGCDRDERIDRSRRALGQRDEDEPRVALPHLL
jgi:hypothetical protein